MIREAEKRTSPWKRVLQDYLLISWVKAVVTIILVTSGFFLSSETGDWMWLSRAGCVVVIVGIIAAIFDIEKALAGKSKPHLYGEDLGKEAEREERDVKELARQIDYWMLIAGNLIWGFGDLIGRLINK